MLSWLSLGILIVTMPELPEVETVRRGLNKLLVGQVFESVKFDYPKGFPNTSADVDKFLIGSKVTAVRRRAKVLLIDLNTKYTLVVHLKMTGQLVFRGEQTFAAGHPSDSLVSALPAKATRVIFGLNSGAKLYFNDQRKFGWVRLLPTDAVPEIDFFKKVGPEPLEADFTWQVLRDRLQRRKGTTIKAALLDQTVLAGVGNIYADESLWGAKLHPATLVRGVSDSQIKLLHKSLTDVLQLSIDKGGSTDRNYVDAEGHKGSYLQFASVFRREGQACPRCGTIIIKTRVAGRGTHLCPKEQRLLK